MSKQYAHLHAMAKTSVKFQNDWQKTVGGVALTSQLLTNGQTDERTGLGAPISHLRANAGRQKWSCLVQNCVKSIKRINAPLIYRVRYSLQHKSTKRRGVTTQSKIVKVSQNLFPLVSLRKRAYSNI